MTLPRPVRPPIDTAKVAGPQLPAWAKAAGLQLDGKRAKVSVSAGPGGASKPAAATTKPTAADAAQRVNSLGETSSDTDSTDHRTGDSHDDEAITSSSNGGESQRGKNGNHKLLNPARGERKAPPQVEPTLKARALKLLAAREHSRHELVQKLKSHAAAPAELVEVLDALDAKGFINEQRVADSLVHRRGPKLGAARVAHELRAKGLDPDMVRGATAQLRHTELERAAQVWAKKFGEVAANSSDRSKQMRFLISRGFSLAVVGKVIKGGVQDGEGR